MMGDICLPSRRKVLQSRSLTRNSSDLGKLSAIPRFHQLVSIIPTSSGRSCYQTVHDTMDKLGRAIQLGQHRQLIDSLNSSLDCDTLAAMTAVSLGDSEVCAAFAVYLTALEQAYHWPRDVSTSTPEMLENHKLVIQMLNQPQLREILQDFLGLGTPSEQDPILPEKIAQTALYLARSILEEAQLAKDSDMPLPRDTQDTVNLLYRTCRSYWGDQGDYRDVHSHKEFGRLHEVLRASGTQRRMQELFEESDGISCLQALPELLENLPSSSHLIADVFTQLQFAVTIAREELFTVSIDEVIWGRVFANFSKAVGFCDISAGGGDAPIFWMLDSLCGQTNPNSRAALPEELELRSRFFPSRIREVITRLQALPSVRAYVDSEEATDAVKDSFKALERQRFELYEMHRKKAARIGLALRAGQRGTSAGVGGCPYSTPEKQLAKTLSSAVTARFGENTGLLLIDAMAQSHSRMFDDNACTYSARVRFNFCTPLAIGPGDCLLVSVQLSDGSWQTRTYSITYAYTTHGRLDQSAHQIAEAAEVYIRNKGLVSKYLCDQTQGCQVRVAVKPASHFRLIPNAHTHDTTVFVAQGGALGIFVAWLESQREDIGKYKLIVGTRQFCQLGFKEELLKLSADLKQCLRIVVVLSRPADNDVSILESAGIETYRGRVTDYLRHCSSESFQAAYVCGTSSFGLDVAKVLSFEASTHGDHGEGQRLEPITTSHLPPIRVHVAPETHATPILPVITSSQLAMHNSPSDLWIAVGDNVYDITSLSKFHPGGEKILMGRAGRQAQDLFESVHGGSVDIESMLANMIVGRLSPPEDEISIWGGNLDKIVEIQNDVTNHSRFEKLPGSSQHDLSEVPPTYVIYAAVECFSRDWCSLLQEVGASRLKQCGLMRGWLSLKKALGEYQAATYSKHGGDFQVCRKTVTMVYGILRKISSEIHLALDGLKSEVVRGISVCTFANCEAFESCTERIIRVLEEQTKALAQ